MFFVNKIDESVHFASEMQYDTKFYIIQMWKAKNKTSHMSGSGDKNYSAVAIL